jgi:hypothetical protein
VRHYGASRVGISERRRRLLLTVVGCGEESSSGFVRPPSVSFNAGALAAGSVSGPAAFLRKRTCAIGAPRIRGGEQDCRQCPDVTHSAIASGRVLERSRRGDKYAATLTAP